MAIKRRTGSTLKRVPPRDQIPTTHSTLAALFLQAFYDTGAPGKWNDLMYNYIYDFRNAVPRNRKDQASHRGNLQKELLKPDMTWGVFLKGMKFLGATSFDIVIKLHLEDGSHPELYTTVNLGQRVHIPPEPETTPNLSILSSEEEQEFLKQHSNHDDNTNTDF